MAIIEPVKGKNEKVIPPVGTLFVNPVEAKNQIEKAVKNGAQRRFLFNSSLCVDNVNNVDTLKKEGGFFLAGPALGAPVAVMALEKLIALGARRIILYGWCGAISAKLSIGDVLVPLRAKIGEGTSQYYQPQASCQKGCGESTPNQQFSQNVAARLIQENINPYHGCVWSTDGVYREERETLLELHRKWGVDAVDMEFSALCSAALFRGVEFAAVLVVSDITCGKKWQPGQKKEVFLRRCEQIASLCCNGEFLYSI